MRRGDLVTVAAPGDYGKPRPAVVIQGDVINQAEPDSVILALMTGTLRDAPLLRLTIEPTPTNGLQKSSQVMVDKLVTVRRENGKVMTFELKHLHPEDQEFVTSGGKE